MTRYPHTGYTIPSVSAEDFFTKYISQRTPVIIRGLLDDETFKAREWVCLYISAFARVVLS